ncbi:hypothetical protein RRG53_01440 [Mycoplasmopsis cynos]|uniref:hypothetical protein n=1 Tax=Mycoplasmopsis cynos TaxID=171284 RepID=UPI002AFE5A50|nr:hypothetical protein [Mycoplasmopsis cynos]WQQ18717.1 hypothetical protein RRG53_01435 [Mycoplasmopsis cynos]WQQ18718.1 hypothetical protein RRG53_01440 [Mycoplasmopsis cynos]
MSKYKKIFSGLGLLSISTLIGVSVVACAKTKVEKEETPAPGTSESKDLATIKNEASVEVEKLQGHKKYAELKAIIDKENATIEELNSAKTSAIEELNKYKENVQTAIEAITDNTKKEELKKEIETANSYSDLKTIKDKIESKPSPDAKPENDGKDNPDKKPDETDNPNQGNSGNSAGKDNNGKTEPEKDKKNEGENPAPGTPQTPTEMTVEQKATALIAEIKKNAIGYPKDTAPALKTLENEVNKIKSEANKTNEVRLASLVSFEAELKNIKDALAKAIKDINALPYPEVQLNPQKEKSAKDKFKDKLNTLTKVVEISKVLPTDWAEKIKKYNDVFKTIGDFINTNNLKKGFVQTDNSTTGDRTEYILIYNIYETLRANYEKKINALKSLEGDKKKEYIKKFNKINQNNIIRYKKTADWLLSETKKMIDEFKKAEAESKKTKQTTEMPSASTSQKQ